MPYLVPNFSWQLQSILSFVLTLIFVSFVLRSKNPPGSTWAWLLFIAIIPYLGIPAYLFFSGRKITTLQKKATFQIPPERGNFEVLLLTSGIEAYDKMFSLIAEAKVSIYLSTFIFSNDAVGLSLLAALTKKVEEGVRVRILLDSFGSKWVRQPSFQKFKEAGGKLGYFMPLIHNPFRGRSNLRNHRKILVVDGATAMLGGMNIAREYMGPEPFEGRWIDLALYIDGPSATDIENVFTKDWHFATGELLSQTPSRETTKQNLLQIVASGPDVSDDPLYDTLLTLIFKANTRVWIASPYFIPDEALARALQIAARRGVEIRILIPKKSNHFLADLARGSYLRQLSASNCKISFMPAMIHAKAFLIDDSYALVGSANFDMRSLLYNYEIGALMTSQVMTSALENWFAKSLRRATEDLPHAGFWKDMAEGVGRVLGPLI